MAYAFPVKDVETIKKILQEIKQAHPKASHCCYAYRLGPLPKDAKSSDDGEPSGSAGKPLLNVLLSKDLQGVLIVVIRYFGGSLLGVPGLIKAYKQACLEALALAEIKVVQHQAQERIQIEYTQLNTFLGLCKRHSIQIIQQHIDNHCTFEIQYPQAKAGEWKQALADVNLV